MPWQRLKMGCRLLFSPCLKSECDAGSIMANAAHCTTYGLFQDLSQQPGLYVYLIHGK